MAKYIPTDETGTEFWTSYWTMLHLITYLYPDNPDDLDKLKIMALFDRLRVNLPCKCCLYHYDLNLQSTPLPDSYNNRQELTKWLIDLHNSINIRKAKPVMNYNQVDDYYKDTGKVNQFFIDRYNLNIIQFMSNTENNIENLVETGFKQIVAKIEKTTGGIIPGLTTSL